MFGLRFLVGAAAGAAIVYFYDPKAGTQRRAWLRGTWERNQEPVKNAASQAATQAGDMARRAGSAVTDRVTDRSDEPAGVRV